MDYKSVVEKNNSVVINGVMNFEPKHVFECGQCFRWNKEEDDSYTGIAYGKVINVSKIGNDVILKNTNLEDFKNIWEKYFDLKREYGPIKKVLSKDPLLKESVEFGGGIRILNQEPFEMLISFIISANNQIPRIKKCVNEISKKWGNEVKFEGKSYYSFPNQDELSKATIEDLRNLGLGFRDKYIYNTVKMVNDGKLAFDKKNNGELLDEIEETSIKHHLPTIVAMHHEDCHKNLMKYSGVGPKVADCIMLFSMEKQEAFPVDVWVKKAMQYFYHAPETTLPKIRKFGQDVFGDLAGFAQQYLFYNARENKIKIED